MSSRGLRALWWKDLRLQGGALIFVLGFEAILLVGLVGFFPERFDQTAGLFLQAIACLGTFEMTYRIAAADERRKSILFLKTLPTTVGQIYGAKFVLVVLGVVVNAAWLTGVFLATRLLGPWTLPSLGLDVLVLGATLQLLLAITLASFAFMTGSERAIWVPLPLVLLVGVAYVWLRFSTPTVGESVLAPVMEQWILVSVSAVGLALLLVLLTLGRVRRRTTLA